MLVVANDLVSGSKSRFSNSNQKSQKGYTSYIQFGARTWDTFSFCTCKSGLRTIGGCAHVVDQLYYLFHKNIGEDLPSLVPRSRQFAENIINISEFASARRQFKRTIKRLPDEDEPVMVSGIEFYVCYVGISIEHHDARQWHVESDCWSLCGNWRDNCSYLNCEDLSLLDESSSEEENLMDVEPVSTNNNSNNSNNDDTRRVPYPPIYIHRVTTRKKDNSHIFRKFLR